MVDTTLSDQPFQDKTVLTDDRLVFLEDEYTQTQRTNLAELYEYYGDKNDFFPYLGQIDASTTSPNTLLDKSGWYVVVNNTGTPLSGWPTTISANGGILEILTTGTTFKQEYLDKERLDAPVKYWRILAPSGLVTNWNNTVRKTTSSVILDGTWYVTSMSVNFVNFVYQVHVPYTSGTVIPYPAELVGYTFYGASLNRHANNYIDVGAQSLLMGLTSLQIFIKPGSELSSSFMVIGNALRF